MCSSWMIRVFLCPCGRYCRLLALIAFYLDIHSLPRACLCPFLRLDGADGWRGGARGSRRWLLLWRRGEKLNKQKKTKHAVAVRRRPSSSRLARRTGLPTILRPSRRPHRGSSSLSLPHRTWTAGSLAAPPRCSADQGKDGYFHNRKRRHSSRRWLALTSVCLYLASDGPGHETSEKTSAAPRYFFLLPYAPYE